MEADEAERSVPNWCLKERMIELRGFFYFPERELYLNLRVPRSERPWRSFVLCLELGPDFAPELPPGRDSFQLFTVPIENRVR